MQSFNFQVARADEAEKISSFVNGAYRGDHSKAGWTTEADLLGGQRADPDMMRAMICDSQSVILLMRGKSEVSQEIVGCVYLKKMSGSVVYLGMLTVDPQQQARGMGKTLLAHAESYSINHFKCSQIEMTVIDLRKELLAWYERRGYCLTSEERDFPFDDPRYGEAKRRDFKFKVLTKSFS